MTYWGLFFFGIIWAVPTLSFAGWETGAKIGFDSNVNRSIHHADSDGYLSGYLSFLKDPSGQSRLDWTFAATLEGTAYAQWNDLNYAVATLAPGLTYIPHRVFMINVSPFVEAKGVVDSDQSALAWGGKVRLKQQIGEQFYTGQYYIYRNSRANKDTYSYTENIIGLFGGLNWTPRFFTEIGYEYSHGDSFRDVGKSGQGSGSGKGKRKHYSSTFNSQIIRETVDQHTFGISAGLDWTPSIFSFASYYFSTMTGDSGDSQSHIGYVGIGYRF